MLEKNTYIKEGRIVETYENEEGWFVEDYRKYSGGPLEMRVFLAPMREERVFFDTLEGKERPYRRIVIIKPDKLALEQWLDDSLDVVKSETEYVYDSKFSLRQPVEVIDRNYSRREDGVRYVADETIVNHEEKTVTDKKYYTNGRLWMISEQGRYGKKKLLYRSDKTLEKEVQEDVKGNLEERAYKLDGKTIASVYKKTKEGESWAYYSEDGKHIISQKTKDSKGNYKCVEYLDDGKTLKAEAEYDRNGRGFKKTYWDDGKTLHTEKKMKSEKSFEQWTYERDGKTLQFYVKKSDEKEVCKYYNRGKLIKTTETYEEQRDVIRKATYDAKGKLLSLSRCYITTEQGILVICNNYDSSGKLVTITTEKRQEGKLPTIEVRDTKGKLLEQRVDTGDKSVVMEMNRSFWDKVLGLYLGIKREGRWGNVSYYKAQPERKEVNTKLSAIFKDRTLSGGEKKTKMREIVAQYRAEYRRKAPNSKVDKALKRYLIQEEKNR